MKVYKVLVNIIDGIKYNTVYLDKFGYYFCADYPFLKLLPEFVENNPSIFQLLNCCKKEYNYEKERDETILALKNACGIYGDLEWDDSIHLSDIIDKHLVKHIEKYAETYHQDKLKKQVEFIKGVWDRKDLRDLRNIFVGQIYSCLNKENTHVLLIEAYLDAYAREYHNTLMPIK